MRTGRKLILVIFIIVVLLFAFRTVFADIISDIVSDTIMYKPIIYIYPEEEIDVDLTLDFDGEILYSYPKYNEGWRVNVTESGVISQDEKEYPYLFWEGQTSIDWYLGEGFVVPGSDTATFLEEKLAYMGLNRRETTDFITYWLPQMESNTFNLITFQNEIYSENIELNILPEPDTVIRVYMVYKPLDRLVKVEEQFLELGERSGYTVVEWGGSRY